MVLHQNNTDALPPFNHELYRHRSCPATNNPMARFTKKPNTLILVNLVKATFVDKEMSLKINE